MMKDKLYLRWNDYESCILNSFEDLRRENDFLDVTLVSDDEIIMKAHKVVLSACSPFFRHILRYSSVNQPIMLFIDGVKSHDLKLVLDYVYQGEVKLYQDSLGSFLKATEKLKISGLSERAMEPRSKVSKDNETNIIDVLNQINMKVKVPPVQIMYTIFKVFGICYINKQAKKAYQSQSMAISVNKTQKFSICSFQNSL